jgi:hypothetical protein
MCRTRKAGAQWMVSSAMCGIMWGRAMCPSSTQAIQPLPCASHYRLSLLAALHGDGPGRSTPRRFAQSQICDQRMPNVVS